MYSNRFKYVSSLIVSLVSITLNIAIPRFRHFWSQGRDTMKKLCSGAVGVDVFIDCRVKKLVGWLDSHVTHMAIG